jgi:DNA-binding transcriptional LysR family regulator
MSRASKLGVRLFHRTTQGVSLTETGEQFVSAVAPALGQIREAMERAGNSYVELHARSGADGRQKQSYNEAFTIA